MINKFKIETIVNDKKYTKIIEPRLLASDFIRDNLNLTGTHVGCEHGVCGSCTIKIDGVTSRSCLKFAVQLHGKEVETVESLNFVLPAYQNGEKARVMLQFSTAINY